MASNVSFKHFREFDDGGEPAHQDASTLLPSNGQRTPDIFSAGQSPNRGPLRSALLDPKMGTPRRQLHTVAWVFAYACAVYGLLVLIMQGATFVYHRTHPPPTTCDCGNSTAEALSLGCKYDSLAAAWLPPHCRDDELTAEFESSGLRPHENGSWAYWSDLSHTQEISIEEVAALADIRGRFYMSWEWHVVHCMFYWRKQYRFQFNEKMVEPRSDSEGHIKHCWHVITTPRNTTTAIPVFVT